MRKIKSFYNKFTKEFLTEELITKNKSINQVSRENGVNKQFIRNICRTYNISTQEHANKSLPITKEELYDLHTNKHLTQREIGKKYNVTKRSIHHLFKKYGITGIDNRKFNNKNKRRTTLTKEILDFEYTISGLSKGDIERKYQIGQLELDSMFEEYGIPLINSTNKSSSEVEIGNWLESLGYKVDRKRKDIITPLELDIFLPDKKLAIEYNGVYYHSHKYLNSNYHLNKTELCEEKDIQLLHIFDTEWHNKKELCKSLILSKISKQKSYYARKCYVEEIDSKTLKQFESENHMLGHAQAKVKLGLFVSPSELVAVMSFGKPRYNKQYEWELIRYCSKMNLKVTGGASKMFQYFVKNYSPNSIISYANRRYSNGNLYNKLGFKFKTKSQPNFFYSKNGKLFSRVAFQKYKLKDKLNTFDPTKTELENMEDNGYYRVYDSGNLVYIWTFQLKF